MLAIRHIICNFANSQRREATTANMEQDSNNNPQQPEPIKRTVLDYDDIRQMIPFFDGKPKLCRRCMHLLALDKVNWIHDHNCDTPGVPFVQGLLRDLDITVKVGNSQVLDHLPQGGFITVSNHPFGALDGIMLIKLIGERRPDFKVMVNMILNYISAMRPNFIAVDALQSDDPARHAQSLRGIAECLHWVKQGHALGFFPAGAVSKFTWDLHIEDRTWQPTVMRLIQKLKVPVIPVYFHGHNSVLFTILGMIDWRLRTLKLPSEVFRRKGATMRVSIGNPISPEVQAQHSSTPQELGEFLRQQTYAMKRNKVQ